MTHYHRLFIANLPSDMTEDQLRVVCEPHGPIRHLNLFTNEETGEFTGTARLTYQTDDPVEPILAALNAHRFGKQRMAVSPSEMIWQKKELTGAQQELVQHIADQLNEEDPTALHQIGQIVGLCGDAFARGILEDTLEVEAGDGIWLAAQNRRRTPGGAYFHLAQKAMAPRMRLAIFPYLRRKKKKKKKSAQQPAPTEKTAPNEAEEATPTAAVPTGNDNEVAVAEPPGEVEETPVQNTPEPAAPVAADTPSPQDRLADLQRALQEANEQLAAVKAGKVKVSPMVAMKAIVDTKRALDDFLRQHPELG